MSSGGTDYVYGNERLYASTSGTKTWYGGDALGSVRETLNNSGAVQSTINYDPWGVVQSGTVPTFGFTGEQQDGSLVNLRARWYNVSRGAITSRDPFAGDVEQPYSLHQYVYALGNPVVYTDPAGTSAIVDGDGGATSCSVSPLHEPNATLSNQEACPLGIIDRYLSTVKNASQTFGLPWQVVAGILESEIELDTGVGDFAENLAYSTFPILSIFRGDPGPGIGNTHLSTVRQVSEYFATNYKDCADLQLNLHNESKQYLSLILTDTDVNIQVVSGVLRYLADYRFGKDGKPSLMSHSNLSMWSITDVVSIWHGYRFGVPGISPNGQGFVTLRSFQDRSISVYNMLSKGIMTGSGAQESILDSIPIITYYFSLRGRLEITA